MFLMHTLTSLHTHQVTTETAAQVRSRCVLCSWHGNRKVLGRPGDTHQHLKNEKSTFDIIMYLSITIHNITTGFRSQALIRDFIYTCMYIVRVKRPH